MKLELLPAERFIQINNLKPVTNPVLCERGVVPTENGILSRYIFGSTTKDRKDTFAYIDLAGIYIQPHIYKEFRRLFRHIDNLVNGTEYFDIVNGELKVSTTTQNTGLQWLYDNWEKIKFSKNSSYSRNERIDLLEGSKKEQVFTKYWVIMPAFYRDISYGKKTMSHDELNDKYSKLIRLANLSRQTNNFDFIIYSNQASIQNQLIDIYDYLKGKLEKKKGILRKAALGKSVDYASRLVITAPRFDSNTPEENYISLDRCGIPLAQACSLFFPFVMHYLKNWVRREFETAGTSYPVILPGTKEVTYIDIEDPMLYYNDDYLKKKIKEFITGDQNRFSKIEIPIKDKAAVNNKPVYMTFKGRSAEDNKPETISNIYGRPATWCDILYQACVDVTEDKYVVLTRYPVVDYFGSAIQKIHIESTIKTMPVYIGTRIYKHYPIIDFKLPPEQVGVSFVDTLTLSNMLLKGFGGDYDGDQLTVKPIFTQEANIEAEKLINAKSNIITIEGKVARESTNECIQTLYAFTRE